MVGLDASEREAAIICLDLEGMVLFSPDFVLRNEGTPDGPTRFCLVELDSESEDKWEWMVIDVPDSLPSPTQAAVAVGAANAVFAGWRVAHDAEVY